MLDVTLTLRVLTPLFMAGADQTAAEIRAPSFRGLMRYWQRALVGGLVGTDMKGLEKVIEAEKAVFGMTEIASSVSIRISAISHAPQEFMEPISVRVGGRWQSTGKGYLLWSMTRSGRADRNNLKPARWYFPPGTTFKVTLSTRGKDDTRLKQALAALWLLTQLGSIGSRSRHCAGSIVIQEVDTNPTSLPFNFCTNIRELQEQLQTGITVARGLYNHKLDKQSTREAHFDVLARGNCRIWILQDNQPWRSAEEAMRILGERLQNFRSHVNIRQRQIFGLPLRGVSSERRASPLLLRVTKLQREQYVGIAVLFKTTSKNVFFNDYKIIEDWINEFHGKQEVML